MKEGYLITGGAGFIGINAADHYLELGKRVILFDNFSRAGTEENVRWLCERHGNKVIVVKGDVRSSGKEFRALVEDVDVVIHLAGQVAVTTSVIDPAEDFEINARGTFNVLEAVRNSERKPILLYSSTNKVYGKMEDLQVEERDGRYVYSDLETGVDESRPLEFYSPYGCSKGSGDQYVMDYARIYNLRTVVFRQSCIYGPHQFGIEDQGWVAWFAIRALQGLPFTIYGDGKQVRDVLCVSDLLKAYDAAIENIETATGQAYNIGGGPSNTLSLLEFVDLLKSKFHKKLDHNFDDWRPGDQLVYISSIEKASRDLGWRPQVVVDDGVSQLIDWLDRNRALFSVSVPSSSVVELAA